MYYSSDGYTKMKLIVKNGVFVPLGTNYKSAT